MALVLREQKRNGTTILTAGRGSSGAPKRRRGRGRKYLGPGFGPQGGKRQKRRKRRGADTMFGDTKRPPTETIASSYFTQDTGVGAVKWAGIAPPADMYQDGSRMHGCEYLTSVGGINAGNNVMSGYVSAITGATNYSLPIGMDAFTRLSSIASNFSKFIFRKLCFEYTPMTGTSQSGGMAMAYNPDPIGARNFSHTLSTPPTFNQVMSFAKSVITPWWKPACFAVDLLGKTLFYTDDDSASGTSYTAPSVRQAAQGSFMAIGNATAGSTAVYGHVCVRYIVDFYGPNPFISAGPDPPLAKELRLLQQAGKSSAEIVRSLQSCFGDLKLDSAQSPSHEEEKDVVVKAEPSYKEILVNGKALDPPSSTNSYDTWLELGRKSSVSSLRADTLEKSIRSGYKST